MTLRMEYRTVAPGAVEALTGLNRYSDTCSISQRLRRLIEVLVSQINGCTYCIDVHSKQSILLGEPQERIDALAQWQAATLFSVAEIAAFAWAESVTNINMGDESDARFEKLKDHFSEVEIVDLTFIVLSMNAWNRLAISFGREAPTDKQHRVH
ncbi:MAG: carboxymuconolactone decarboxylase family protein [Rhizobiaceae bacterium]|nr:carboxymuconolactone decarboxylase family protein [Rhizobiaceae bacterium]